MRRPIGFTLGVLAAVYGARLAGWVLTWVLAHWCALAVTVVSLAVFAIWWALPCLEADEVDG